MLAHVPAHAPNLLCGLFVAAFLPLTGFCEFAAGGGVRTSYARRSNLLHARESHTNGLRESHTNGLRTHGQGQEAVYQCAKGLCMVGK